MLRTACLAVSVCLLLAVSAWAEGGQPTEPLLIDDFESEASLWNWGRWLSDAPAEMTLSSEHISHGERALKVVFPEAQAYGIHTFALPRDWSAYGSLRFDIYYDAPSGDPSRWLGFNVYIDDFESTGWATNFHQEGWRLRPGWNYRRLDIDCIAGRRDAIDLTRVKALYFIFSGFPAGTTLYFDHIRLEPRPPAEALTCPACGAEAEPGALACPKCGRSLLRLRVAGPGGGEKTEEVTVTAPGRFELSFDGTPGTISRWFDLARDPERRRNLVAEYARLLNNKFGFTDETGKPRPGSAYLAPTEPPVVLEASPLRARVRLVCPGARQYGGGALHPHVQGTTDYTVYPTGRVFIRNQLRVVGETYRSKHFMLNMLTSWAAYHENRGEAIRSAGRDFILHTHRGPEVTADALLVWHTGERPTTYFNSPYERVFYRSGVGLAEAVDKVLEPGTSLTWCFMLQLKPDDIDSEEAARPYALDYRTPASITVTQGRLVTNDPGDAQGDGFNEAEGCYVLEARKGRLRFTFAAGAVTHYWPVFKVLNWPGGAPALLRVGDRTLRAGYDFLARADDGVLLIQLLQPLRGRVEIEAAPQPGRQP